MYFDILLIFLHIHPIVIKDIKESHTSINMKANPQPQEQQRTFSLIFRDEIPPSILNQFEIINVSASFSTTQKVEKLIQIFPYVKTCNNVDISTYNCFKTSRVEKIPTFFANALNVGFPMLKVLSVRNSKVRSIEGIDRIDLPSLTDLNTEDNPIANLRPMRKVSYPSILSLSITNLVSPEGQLITTANFGKQMMTLHLDCLPDPVLIHDVRFLAKLVCKMDTVRIMAKQRIQQKPVHKIFQKKWKAVDVRVQPRY